MGERERENGREGTKEQIGSGLAGRYYTNAEWKSPCWKSENRSFLEVSLEPTLGNELGCPEIVF